MLTSWVSGCANHGSMDGVRSSPATPATKLDNQLLSSTGISGLWLCIDSKCEDGTIKKISDRLDSVETSQTERLASSTAYSICSVHQVERMSPSHETDHYSLTETSIRLVSSPENTQDCADEIGKLNQIKPVSVSVEIIRDADLAEITINGVRYRQIGDTDLKFISEQRAQLNARNASISGDWVCADDGCGNLHQTISGDRKILTTESTIELSGESLKCHVIEDSQLEITDNTEPQRLYVTRTRGDVRLVPSAENMEDCASVVSDFNQKRNGSESQEKITIERDGNRKIMLLGKNYVRT